jgi:signal transduction histidine kinase
MNVATIDSAPDPRRRSYAAPIEYADVRVPINTVRAVGGAVIAAAALLAQASGVATSPAWVIAGLAIAADGVYRRQHGSDALPMLVVDISAVGIGLTVWGHSPGIEVQLFVYVLAAAMLLLAPRKAAIAILLATAWMLPIAAVGVMSAAGATQVSGDLALLAVIALVFTILIATLLFTAGRSLRAAIEHQQQALETERRAGELKNEFVSMVSHELRTPLTSIAGFTDTLRESWTSFGPAEIDEFLLIMRRETEHLRDLVEDILVIPRLEAGQLRLAPAEIDVRTAVFNSGDALFIDAGTDFVVTIPGGVNVFADRVRLSQVLRNLLENAHKYGGDQILVDSDRIDDLIRITISDNGPGVPEEDAERIFDHFEQLAKGDSRSATGVGLGLPIARKLVRAMGGDLWYEPRFPIGARFCFTLPMNQGAVPPEAKPLMKVTPSRSLDERPQRPSPLAN